MTRALTRTELLRRGIGGGALLTITGAELIAPSAPAEAAVLPDSDLVYLRLLIAAELLKGDFEAQALRSGKLAAPAATPVRRMRADDSAHYNGLSVLMAEGGEMPATSADIDFSYPRGSFASEKAIARLAWKLTTLTMSAYLGAVESVQTSQLRLPLGQIAANEAQQLSSLAQLMGRPLVGGAFAPALRIDAVSAELDEYES